MFRRRPALDQGCVVARNQVCVVQAGQFAQQRFRPLTCSHSANTPPSRPKTLPGQCSKCLIITYCPHLCTAWLATCIISTAYNCNLLQQQ